MARTLSRTLVVLLVCACEAPAPSVITPEDLRAVFVRRSVCQGVVLSGPLVSVLGNADDLDARASRELDCGRTADSCEAFLACSDVDTTTTCDRATAVPECDGDTLVTCDLSGYARRMECTTLFGNATCLTDESSITRCAIEACDGPNSLSCVDGFIETCGGGVRYRANDCDARGRLCVSDGMRAACVDREEACDSDACEGDTLLDCVSSGLGYVETDCSERIGGGSCSTVDGEAQCVVAEPECTGESVACDGTILRACTGGRFLEIDCAEFLDARCVEDTTGVFGCVSDAWTPG